MGSNHAYESDEVKDPRSTGRKRLRRALLKQVADGTREYKCEGCGYIPSISWNVKSRSGDILDANHKNGNIMDNDPSNGSWLCRPCHLKYDRGIRQEKEKGGEFKLSYGYGDLDEF